MTHRSLLARLAPAPWLALVMLLVLLLCRPSHAAPGLGSIVAWRYVAPGGACQGAAPCYATIQAAVDAASEDDIIKIAAGTYTDVQDRSGSTQIVHIAKRVTLRGGYRTGNGYADPPRPDIHSTILDAQQEGRVVVIDRAGPTLEGLVITGGAGYFSGGGIYAESGAAIILNCDIVDNQADGDGGGVFINRGSVEIRGSRISNNRSNWSAGLRLINDVAATVIGNLVNENVAQIGAGGVDLDCCGGKTSLIARNVIIDNRGGGWGGGVSVATTNAEVINNIIVGNQAVRGAGICLDGMPTHPANISITHNTLVGDGDAHGVWIGDHVSAVLTNNIIVDFGSGVDNTSPADSMVTARNSLFRGNSNNYGSGVTSVAEVMGNPAFVNPVGGDYHIAATSAARDHGRDTGVIEDIDGQPRPLGPASDIGADEVCRPAYLPLLARSG